MSVCFTRLSKSKNGDRWQWDEVNLQKFWTVLEELPQYDATRKFSKRLNTASPVLGLILYIYFRTTTAILPRNIRHPSQKA